ncbi:MFS transporter [Puia sp. P3]|uniref:MFS transporter n=1 Tax=Puia sp. P3 TaxID=3423952 RepID=UPI003D674EDE
MSSTSIAPAKAIRKIIIASSVGTLIEWYDFYIFGSLATVIAGQFFPKSNPTAALLSTLATFAAGFVVRPFGALVFGRLGDLIGRKYTFLLTLILMGVPPSPSVSYRATKASGFWHPCWCFFSGSSRGLALGGEYGGAATYVAEHSPINQRGFIHPRIQATATVGLFVSLGIILLTRHVLDPDTAKSIEKFNSWGWRIPFLVSILLVAISVYIRLKMQESPLFQQLKTEGRLSANPSKKVLGTRQISRSSCSPSSAPPWAVALFSIRASSTRSRFSRPFVRSTSTRPRRCFSSPFSWPRHSSWCSAAGATASEENGS